MVSLTSCNIITDVATDIATNIRTDSSANSRENFRDNSRDNSRQNFSAMAASMLLHACLAAWILSSALPVEIMPQQMIQVTLVAAPGAEIVEKKTERNSNIRRENSILPTPSAEPEKLAALTPAAGQAAGSKKTEQMATTKPLFDAAYLNNPVPEYPDHAKRRNMSGTVLLDVAVSAMGIASNVLIAESSGFAVLDESAKNAVSRWKFVPARRGGETVEARVIVPVEFKLE